MIPKLLTVFALAGLGAVTLAPDLVLKATDHRKLGKDVAAYWTARTEVEGIDESFSKLSTDIKKVDATLRKKDQGPLLALVADWREIFWTASQSILEDRKLKKGKITEEKSAEPVFTYWAPKKFSSKKGPAPIVLIVPDADQTAQDVLETSWADEAIRGGAMLVVVSIEGDPATWSGDAGFAAVMGTFGRVIRTNMFGFDFDRIYLAGHGKGFAAAAATAAYFPHLFAGLIGRGEIPSADPTNFRNVATYLGGGGESATFARGVEELGYGNSTTGEDSAAAIWAWMQEHTRNSSPAHITFAPPTATSRSAGWVKVTGIDLDGSPKVDAVADRASNTITITAKGVSIVDVYFNDVLVDLDQPVRVIVNGGTPHEDLFARNPKYMVDRAYDFGDWASVFTATASYDVPSTN